MRHIASTKSRKIRVFAQTAATARIVVGGSIRILAILIILCILSPISLGGRFGLQLLQVHINLMPAFWNLQCTGCNNYSTDVECSMFSIPVCPDCGAERALAPCGSIRKSGIFPFTVNHVNGSPMEITDLGHLRRVERDYGVCFSAFNKANIRDLDPIRDLPKFRGNTPYGRHE